jgi:hypothetical protein
MRFYSFLSISFFINVHSANFGHLMDIPHINGCAACLIKRLSNLEAFPRDFEGFKKGMRGKKVVSKRIGKIQETR